jgi:hypothetical protein
MSLTARAAVQRGLFSLRANWELVVVVWLRSLLMFGLVVLGLLPPMWVLGERDLVGALTMDAAGWSRWSASATQRFLASQEQLLAPMLMALGITFLIWTLAFVLYCHLQGGILGTLVAADRQCASGLPRHWELFRTFSLRGLVGWGQRHVWRYFWLLNLLLALYLVWMLLAVCLVGLAVLAAQRWGGPAAFGLGCVGAMPLLFGLLVLGLGSKLAQAALPSAEATVWSSLRRAAEVLGTRLGAVVLLTILWILAAMTVGVVLATVSFLIGLLVGEEPSVKMALQAATTLVQWLIGSVWTVVYLAALVAFTPRRPEGAP